MMEEIMEGKPQPTRDIAASHRPGLGDRCGALDLGRLGDLKNHGEAFG